jgi:rod shape-determining protein MreB
MTNTQTRKALKEPLIAIIGAIRVALEQTPPELSSDIAESGVMLTGGGALLEGLSDLIKTKTNLDVRIADNPLICVAHGASMALEMINNQQMAFVSAE